MSEHDTHTPPSEGSAPLWGRPTRWTVIAGAAGADEEERERAWQELIARYRAAVLHTIERQLASHPQRMDIADDFFAWLFEKKVLHRADQERGRFRCFMQGVIRNYVRQRLRDDRVLPQSSPEDFDVAVEPSSTVEHEEEAAWAQGVLGNAAQRLVREMPRDGELLLRAYGIAPYQRTPRAELAASHGLRVASLNVAIHRARLRLRQLLLEEVQPTVGDLDSFRTESTLVLERLVEAYPALVSVEG